MPSCCLSKHSCLNERSHAMKMTGPFGWGIKCMDCIEGCARQMDEFKPEVDYAPIVERGKWEKKRVALPKCADCGKPISKDAKICKPCRGKRRTAAMPKTCTHPGCRWKARREGLCHSHYWRNRPAPYSRVKEVPV